jgi:hypothetical protein
MRRSPDVQRPAALLLLLVALLPGCAADGAPAAAPELSAEARQYRNDVALRRFSVTVTNDGDVPVTIRGVRLLAPGFAALPMSGPEVDLPPGDRVDLPVPYGEVVCGPPPSPAPDAAELLLLAGSGSARRVTVVLPAGQDLLERLRRKDCALQAVQRATSLTLAPGWVREGERLSGRLVLTRGSRDEQVVLTEAGGTIVYTVRLAGLPAVLAPGQERLEVPVDITATRCDGHALSQNSRAAVFTFYLAVGGAEPVQVPTTADPVLQGQLAELATDTCVPS